MAQQVTDIMKSLSLLLQKEQDDKTDKEIQDKIGALSGLDISIEILQSTGIGKLVNKISKLTSRPDISTSASVLKKKWTDIVTTQSLNVSQEIVVERSVENKVESKTENIKKRKVDETETQIKTEVSAIRTERKVKIQKKSGDERLDRVAKKLTEYFKKDSVELLAKGVDMEAVEDTAEEVAAEIIKVHGADPASFRKALKTYYFALSDKKNFELRYQILNGSITAKELLEMPESDLANPDVRNERQRIEKEDFEKRLPVKKTATSNYKCRVCGKSETYHFQAQTRSADEPMTTFIECIHCGTKWKQY